MTRRHPKIRLVQGDAAISLAMVRRESPALADRDAPNKPYVEAGGTPLPTGGAIAITFALARRRR